MATYGMLMLTEQANQTKPGLVETCNAMTAHDKHGLALPHQRPISGSLVWDRLELDRWLEGVDINLNIRRIRF